MSGASDVLLRLRGGLIVSVQPEAGSVLNAPQTIALLAQCAMRNGAVGVRIEGARSIAAVRALLDVPIVGLLKRRYAGFEPYITTTLEDVRCVVEAGADVVAFDATFRTRFGGRAVPELIEEVRRCGRLAMADCSDPADARAASDAGADIVATTLAGYTAATQGRPLPALDLVGAIATHHPFAVCEGGVGEPSHVRAAAAAGASAVVVGAAITNVDALVRRFAAASPRLG